MHPFLFSSQKQEISKENHLEPYAFFHCVIPINTPNVLLHWHVEAELTYVHTGSAIYQIGEETFYSHESDLIFVPPNTLHSIYPVPGTTHISDTLVFHLDLLGYSIMDQCTITYLRPLFNGSLNLLSHMNKEHPAYKELLPCVKDILTCVTTKDFYFELLLKEKLHHLFYLLFKYNCITETKVTKSTSLHMDKIKKALQYIQDNYKEPITIIQLANLCHFSKTHFMSFFKQRVGISCAEYIIQLRLRIAADLLRTTDLLVSEIALESGFQNLSNFNRQFKSYYGISPKEYRNNLLTK